MSACLLLNSTIYFFFFTILIKELLLSLKSEQNLLILEKSGENSDKKKERGSFLNTLQRGISISEIVNGFSQQKNGKHILIITFVIVLWGPLFSLSRYFFQHQQYCNITDRKNSSYYGLVVTRFCPEFSAKMGTGIVTCPIPF